METSLIYFAKVNIALALFYLLYLVFFRKDTFIKIRRYYFLSAILFSLTYPIFNVTTLGNLINIVSTPVETQTFVSMGDMSMGEIPIEEMVIDDISMGGFVIDDVEQTAAPITISIPWATIGKNILLLGMLFFSLRFLCQLFSIIRIKSRSEKKILHDHSVYILSDEITPFSFFNWIFIHTETHSDEKLRQILIHEQTHVRQWHSVDILLAEMLRVLFWWNPIVWLMKRDIGINLEYLADNAVLEEGINTWEYQYHLLQLTYHDTVVQIVNNFNASQLKQRIMMMNNNKSPMRKLAKYLIVAPLVLLLITANSVYAHTNEPLQEITPPQEPAKKESKIDEVLEVVEREPTLLITANSLNTETSELQKVIKLRQEPIIKEIKSNEVVGVVEQQPRLLITENSFNNHKSNLLKDTKPQQESLKNESISDEVFIVNGIPQRPSHSLRSMGELFEKEMKYPQIAKESGIQGSVRASFEVEVDGTVTNLQILEGVDPSLDEEVLRVINAVLKGNTTGILSKLHDNGNKIQNKRKVTPSFIFKLDGKGDFCKNIGTGVHYYR